MRILHAIHDFLPRHRAGSEIYAFHLAREQRRRGHHVTVLCAEYDPGRDHASVGWRLHEGLPVVEVVNNWVFERFEESYRSPAINRTLEHVLRAVGPDVLHLHSLLNLSFELPALARAQGIPTLATLHDFTLVCPSGGQRVHLSAEHVCHEIEPDRCARCFPESPFHRQMVFGRAAFGHRGGGAIARIAILLRHRAPRLLDRLGRFLRHAPGPALGGNTIERRLERFRELGRQVELWVAPSRSLGADLVRFGLAEDRMEVSDYGFPPLPGAPRETGDGRLRIGFVGTLVWHKGVHVLLEALRELPSDRFLLRLHGDPAVFPSYAARLRELARGLPVAWEGRFEAERVAEVYAGLDVLVVPSLWPENSPLVIHEAAQAGVPVVGSRSGGTAELVRDGENGFLYDPFSSHDLADRLRRLLEEPGLLERFRGALSAVKSLSTDADEWEIRYHRALGRESRSA